MKFNIVRASNGWKSNSPKPTHGAALGPDGKTWEIEINTLDDLLELIEREGEIIIDHYKLNGKEDQGRILLYDDYIE